ncbi:MAG: tetratricopeptide repeat protein, partial [Planctomycetota bacterium]|nr:tetratricopeptide repeat protein [Planctomycetota bacterium]
MSRQSLFVPRAGWVSSIAALLLGVCLENAAGAEPAAPTEAVKGTAVDDSQRRAVLAPAVDEAIRQRMQDRDYGEAIQAIEAAIARGAGATDCLFYLKGRALALQGEYAKAAEVFASVSKAFPQSPWQRRARFEEAAAAVGQGDYRAAERIYRGEAEDLFGSGRKQQIAGIYLEFADAAFQPSDPLGEPDYRKALEFYSAALGAGLGAAKRPEVELLAARCCQELGDGAAAIERFARFADDHPGHALLVEARFRLGECQLSSGKRAEARRTWEDLLAECGQSDSPRIAEAAFRLAETRGIPEPANAAELDLGVAALESFLARFPEHPLASKARLLTAKSAFHLQRFADAADRLQGLLGDERLARSGELPEALELLGRSYQAQSRFDDALAVWRRFLVEHPADERWSGVQQAVIDTEYLEGIEQRRQGRLAEAGKSLAEFLAHHPLDHRCREILFLFGEMLHTEEKFDEAIAAWARLVSKHPGTPEADRGQLRIAETLEQDLGKFEEALDAYRKAEQGSKAADARQAIARLSEKHVSLATEHVFRTNQPVRLRLATRNIESVTIRAYHIDMETYFRKMFGPPGIERLDVGLIDPDKTSELSIAGYRAHQEFQTIVETPFEGDQAGVMAVTASSDHLESTTLAIRSDLDVIVKCSRGEVFVFAENLRTGKPWPGARLLISDGREMLAEAETGPDGVFCTKLRQLAQAETVCVLALSGGHAASNAIGLAGLRIAKGLDHAGYLQTDRPAYRAGDPVQACGWIRRVATGGYAVDEGKQCRLELYDARRRLVRQKRLTLGRFGTFHDAFTLPASCPEGQCRLVVHDHHGRSYDSTLRVHAYRPALVRLVIDCPRSVYYRGETIEGTIRAETCYGAPLAGRQVRYMLGDDLPRTARTDERGVVRFSLPTRQFHETQRVALKAELPQRNLQASVDIQLAKQGYTIRLSTARTVFLAGELFEIRAETFTPEGKPVGEKLALKVFERTTVAGIEGQRLVRTIDLATDQASGVGRTSLALEAGGRYVLRAEGTDPFDHPVSAQTELEISADEDPTRLRVLADRLTWQVGETADVIIHWRGRPALGLITFQAARILGYRLVELRSGPNPLSIPVTAQLASNFELAVAVITDEAHPKGDLRATRRLHQASALLAVERELVIDLAWKRAGGAEGPIRPGEQLELTVKTTDPLGKPVSAEVCLAMLEQSVRERFPLPGAHPADLFRGVSRDTEMRTGSSITFSYHPESAAVDPQILSERQRIETRRAEEESRQSAVAKPGGTAAAGGGFGGLGGMDGPGSGIAGGSEGPPAVVDPPQQAPADPFAADPFAADPFAPPAAAALPPADPWSAPTPTSDEDGYWNPAVITDESGRATVTLEAPRRETTWQIRATGITADTLVGETSRSLVAKKGLSAELRLPLGFVEGDKAEIPVSVHQTRPDGGPIDVVLKTTILGRSVEEAKTIQAAKSGSAELVFQREFLRPEPAEAAGSAGSDPDVRIEFELTAVTEGDRVTVRRVVPLLPFGAAVHAIRSGLATADAAALVEPPEAAPIRSPSLQILVSPTVERCLLDSVLGRPPSCQIETARITADVEIAAADLMASLALRRLLTKAEAADGLAMRELDDRVRSAIGLFVLSQSDDGGWGWTWHSARSQLFATSQAIWALSLAKAAAYPLPPSTLPKALEYLREQLAAAGTNDDAKAVILHAMALAGQGDFNLANRLQRICGELSTRSLLYLALAFAAMDRAGPAGELLDVAAQRDLQADSAPLAELEALRALAAEQVRPGSAKTAVDWLLAHRSGHRWSPERATGPAVQALCGWFADRPFDAGPCRLEIFVNGTAVKTLEIDASSATRIVDVPASLLVSGPQQVRFAITGKGRFAYECILGGLVPGNRLQNTTAAWRVE